jgi:hypothetical protein
MEFPRWCWASFFNPSNPLHEAAMDGHSYTLYHQIIDPAGGTFNMDASTEAPDRLLYDPYEDVQQSLTMDIVGHKPLYGEQIKDSNLYNSCHCVMIPYVDNEGYVQGTFPEQTPCLELENSIYPSQVIGCQTCPMSEAEGAVKSP